MELVRVLDMRIAKQVAERVNRYNDIRITAKRVLERPHFTIELNGEVAGWIGCEKRGAGKYEIVHLSILPGFRRYGLAEEATAILLEMIKRAGGRYAYVRIKRSNRASVKLAQKNGFRKEIGGTVGTYGLRL